MDSIWVFESDHGILPESGGMIVPNGKVRIILPYKNSLFGNKPGGNRVRPENLIYLVGPKDEPVTIGSPPGRTALLIIQLTYKGGYRFTDGALSELTNRLVSFGELYGQQGCELQEELTGAENVYAKISLIQQFLTRKLLRTRKEHMIVDYVTETIMQNEGLVEMKKMEKKTGYSKRYLELLFQHYIGLSPKTLACITRFQKFYHLCINNNSRGSYKNSLHSFYYDQSHFIKEFKTYTGYAPEKYMEINNEFGRILSRRKTN
ncbi:MAG: AraC family transcriptional regulator [Sphingobacteriales bacterium]|nr:AraC family transcriptional regulator [Sphingobacteriales bacterium]